MNKCNKSMKESMFGTLCIWAFFAVVIFPAPVASGEFPTRLILHRAIPKRVEMSKLRAHDRARHRRLLNSVSGVVDFPVVGSYNPYRVGLYYTKVQLGTPAQEFNVQIDTGSDVLWVSCRGCNGCPETTGLEDIELNAFDPLSSTSASILSCSDKRCSAGAQFGDALCDSSNNCAYQFQYGDGSGTQGYYVSDVLHLETVVGGTPTYNSSSKIIFGPHYNLNLQSISVNGQKLAIDPSVFTTSSNTGTIIDSGTTLAYLAEGAYDPFLNAISEAVSQSVRPLLSRGNSCFLIISSVNDVFPEVHLNFAGGASMVLKPKDYLLEQNSIAGGAVWCMGFQKSDERGMNILGGSQPVNVSTSTGSNSNTYIQLRNSSPSTGMHYVTTLIGAMLTFACSGFI